MPGSNLKLRNIKITIEYDGTNFHGWQIQAKGVRTIQGEISDALQKIFKSKITLMGSGRTDSGVHALGQVANFKVNSSMTTTSILRALNANLPQDIVILNVEEVYPKFHAQFSVKNKTYRYTILHRATRCAQQRFFSYHYLYKLNLKLIRQEARFLVGRKDFKSFQAADPSSRMESTVRTIKRIDIKKQGDYIFIDITADGFLYKMVRNIVGTLLDVGGGRLSQGSMKKILAKKNRTFASPPAPAHGLNLMEVTY